MRKMTLRMKLKASALALALAALPLYATAAGLGRLTVLSVLGQPLRAELDITASSDELSSLSARVASPDAFKQAGIEYIPALVGLRLSVDKRANGQPFLSVNSDRPINEPFLDLLVELNWASGRLVREYTFLLDLPESLQKPAAVPSPAALPEIKREVPAPSGVQAPQQVQTPQPKMPPSPSGGASATAEEKPPQKPRFLVETKPAPRQEAKAASRVAKRGDTLAKIAGETKPEGVSLDQMLVALFRSNKDAFDGSNMNRLKAGKILSIPDHEAAASISESEAKQTIVAHSADFNAYRKKLAAAAAATPATKEEAPKQAAGGKIVPRVEDKAPLAAAGLDKLEVSKSDASKDAKAAAAGAARIAAIEEDLVAREKALKEANSRIAELEKNLNDLKKLVELKSQSMAELQKQAAKPAAPAAAPVPPVLPVAPAVPAAPVAAAAPAVPAVPEVKTAQPPPNVEAPAAEKPVEKPAEAATPVVAKPPVPPLPAAAKAPVMPTPKPGFMEDNPEWVYGGGGIVALLLAYLGISRWRRRDAVSGPAGHVSESAQTTNSVFGSTGGQSVDTNNSSLHTDFSQSGMGTIETDEGVDPVAEADVYMAYGRDSQAEEILLDALKADPTRHVIHLKLLEIYAARKSQKQFETVASDLYGQTGGVGPDWAKAALLIDKIDPENPLYGRKPAVAESASEFEFEPAATLLTPPAQEETEHLPGELEQNEQGGDTQPFSLPGIASPMPEESPSSLDFELEFDTPEAASGTPAAEEESGFSGIETLVIPGREHRPVAETSEESEYLDLELQATDLGVKGKEIPATASEAVDFNLNPAPSGESPSAVEDAAMIELERSDAMAAKPLDFSFDFARDSGLPSTAPKSVDLSTIDLDLGETSPVEPAVPVSTVAPTTAAMEEVATKLELAHAYDEMGDKEGARELLQEVMQEGNAEQQASARTKLAQLS